MHRLQRYVFCGATATLEIGVNGRITQGWRFAMSVFIAHSSCALGVGGWVWRQVETSLQPPITPHHPPTHPSIHPLYPSFSLPLLHPPTSTSPPIIHNHSHNVFVASPTNTPKPRWFPQRQRPERSASPASLRMVYSVSSPGYHLQIN